MNYESKYKYFHASKLIWIYRLQNGGHFASASMCQDVVHQSVLHSVIGKAHILKKINQVTTVQRFDNVLPNGFE